MTTVDGNLNMRARRAARAIAINRWSDVAPLLRVRAVARADRSIPAHPIGSGLWLEIALAVRDPACRSGTEFIIRPDATNVAAWDRPSASVWRVAAGNTRRLHPAATAVHRRDDFIIRLAVGSAWTSGALLDVGYFVRRWWPEAVDWHGAVPDGQRDHLEQGRRRGDTSPRGWACALSANTIAVAEPTVCVAEPRASFAEPRVSFAEPNGVRTARTPSSETVAARARALLLALASDRPDDLPPVVVPVARSQYLRKEAC